MDRYRADYYRSICNWNRELKMETIVISIGGSVIVPDKIDTGFLKGLSGLIRKLGKRYRFILVAGGGKTCRRYMDAAKAVKKISSDDLEWIGIRSTRLNAQLLLALLKDISWPKVIENPEKKIIAGEKVIIAAGWKPGFSSDEIAVKLAKNHNAAILINITDVGNVYDRDPDEFPDANPLENLSWNEMKAIVGDKWKPGLNKPFGPMASKEAAKIRLKVIIIGKDINNIERCITGKQFSGTTIA